MKQMASGVRVLVSVPIPGAKATGLCVMVSSATVTNFIPNDVQVGKEPHAEA